MYTDCEDLLPGKLNLDPFTITVHHTPGGHSAGSVCLEIGEYLFTGGDTLFKQNVGNTDNYNGNASQLLASIRYLLSLPKNLIVEPGHKDSTTLRNEERFMKNLLL